MSSIAGPLPKRERGLSLVELMIGLTISMIAILIMQQMVVFFDAQKRGSSGGADAQNTGMIAMHTLESDIRQAGYGLTSLETLYCTMQSSRSFNGRRLIPMMIIPDGMARTSASNPLSIPPGDAGSDIIAVTYGHTIATPEGVPISDTPGTSKLIYQFGKNVTGFNVGDYVLAGQIGQNCTVAQVSNVDSNTRQITVDNSFTGATYAANAANVFNLGARGMTMRVYAIRNGNLTTCDFWTSDCSADLGSMTPAAINALWVPIASNVVGLRAQYGWDTSATADMQVDAYCRSHLTAAVSTCPDPDGSYATPATTPDSACDWTRILTLRLALVSRSADKNPGTINVSDAAIKLWPDDTTGPATTGPSFAVPDRQYRYKVFQSTVPLRNVIWLGAQSSCT